MQAPVYMQHMGAPPAEAPAPDAANGEPGKPDKLGKRAAAERRKLNNRLSARRSYQRKRDRSQRLEQEKVGMGVGEQAAVQADEARTACEQARAALAEQLAQEQSRASGAAEEAAHTKLIVVEANCLRSSVQCLFILYIFLVQQSAQAFDCSFVLRKGPEGGTLGITDKVRQTGYTSQNVNFSGRQVGLLLSRFCARCEPRIVK